MQERKKFTRYWFKKPFVVIFFMVGYTLEHVMLRKFFSFLRNIRASSLGVEGGPCNDPYVSHPPHPSFRFVQYGSKQNKAIFSSTYLSIP